MKILLIILALLVFLSGVSWAGQGIKHFVPGKCYVLKIVNIDSENSEVYITLQRVIDGTKCDTTLWKDSGNKVIDALIQLMLEEDLEEQ